MPDTDDTMATVRDLDELVELVGHFPQDELYVRWSRGPAVDLRDDETGAATSRDALTGVPLPGLSANPFAVEPWWGDRPLKLWVARRLYDYQHLRELRGPGVRPWVLVGEACGRGPDNEPLVRCRRPVAWIDDLALRESQRLVQAQDSREWGPLDRTSA
ncbi:MAG TPA: DUF6098 family protein [Actinoplanes sp.]|nr:DUF6098 family protein [Actinoplanes sp.]